MEAARLAALLERFPSLTVLVVGDFFLDKYLDLDPGLSEPSLETGREAYQVVGMRNYPGAAGTVVNNLRALDVNVLALGVIGDDGEADDLGRGLARVGVRADHLLRVPGRFTPTYLKPMAGQVELNRFDTKNRTWLPEEVEDEVIERLLTLVPRVQGVVVTDQVTEADCGVITGRVRAALTALARAHPSVTMAADSRERIGAFEGVIIKPNEREALKATGVTDLHAAGRALQERTGQPVLVTQGEAGVTIFDGEQTEHVPGVRVSGPIDIVGAGDSAMAGFVAARCAGASLSEAALVGNLVASITIQQVGVTGTATRAEVLARLAEMRDED